MNRIFRFQLFLGIAALILITSCSEAPSGLQMEDPKAVSAEALEDDVVMEAILDEVMDELDNIAFLKSTARCPERTLVLPDSGQFPRTVIHDYGDGCKPRPDGAIRSGKIIITIGGPWLRKGSVRKVTFRNYMHGATSIEGNKRIVCMGKNDNGDYWHTIAGNMKLSRTHKEDTLVIKRQIEKERTLISEPFNRDVPREWLVEGSVKVRKSNGVNYLVETTEPLYHFQGCRWFQSGLKQITVGEDLIQVDYGYVGPEDGLCDSWIKRWINEEEAELIDLSAR